jgi:hypothetical protein
MAIVAEGARWQPWHWSLLKAKTAQQCRAKNSFYSQAPATERAGDRGWFLRLVREVEYVVTIV